jgi:hypothetical protein
MRIIAIIILIFPFSHLQAQSKGGERFIENALRKQTFTPWQKQISLKKIKTITDYFLLLPKSILEAETGINNDSKDFRLQSASAPKGRVNVKAGFLIASPDAHLKMALFRDRISNKDVIAIVHGCGAPPIQYCDYGFLEFDQQNAKWMINRDVFPWDEFNKKCDAIALEQKKENSELEYFIPNIKLPELGTSINVVDAWDTKEIPLFKILWNGQKFEIK